MRHLRTLVHDVWALLRAPTYALLAIGLVLQALYWTLGSPGPTLAGAPRDLATSAAAIGWSLVLLLALPLAALWRVHGIPPWLRGGWGDVRFGGSVTLALGIVLALGMGIATRSPELQATYPWAGEWPGASALHLLAWAGAYALYYVAYEFFYRGFLLRTAEAAWGTAAAIWLQTIASTLVHLGKPLPETMGAIAFGLVLGALAVRSRSLAWPILLHLILGLATDVASLHHQGWLFP